jgi:glycosyltransferase involved in cell wall biosynthesis
VRRDATARACVFVAEEHPAWRHQWAELPADALARRGIATRILPSRAVGAGAWPRGSIVVAMMGSAATVLQHRHRRDRVVLVVPDDVWALTPQHAAELGLDPSALPAVVEQLTAQVEQAAAIAVTAEALVEIVRPLNTTVFLVPFAAPEPAWPKPVPKRPEVRRIGWAGSRGGRESDFVVLRDAYRRLARRPEVRFTFWGAWPSWVHELEPRVEVLPHELIESSAYYAKLAALRFDIAVAPIAATRLNESRSRAKFLEAAVGAGAPLVASDVVGPYRRLAAAGAPILTVPNDSEAWCAALDALLDQPDQRAAITAAARAWVAKEATIETVADDWCRVIEAAA